MVRNMKRVIAAISCFALALGISMTVRPEQAFAAKKQTVYVVESIKCKGTTKSGKKETYTEKISYNKNGLITEIKTPNSEDMTFTIKYNKKKPLQIEKTIDKIAAGAFASKVTTYYSYNKTGQLIRKSGKYPGDDGTFNYSFTWKNGKIVSMKDGSNKTKYTYKNGYIVSKTETMTFDGSRHVNVTNISLDKKGNMTAIQIVTNGTVNTDAFADVKITYDKKTGRVKKMVAKSKNPMMKNVENVTKTVKWKKIKTDQKFVKLIEEQQRQLINGQGGQGAEGFGW